MGCGFGGSVVAAIVIVDDVAETFMGFSTNEPTWVRTCGSTRTLMPATAFLLNIGM